MDKGYIKLHRSINEWAWKSDPKTVALWVYLLTNANWKDSNYRGHQLRAGDIVIGRKALSYETGLTEREIRTCIDKLKKTGEVTSKASNRFTILTIVKWEEYQAEREQATSHASSKRPASDQQATTSKEGKKGRREESDRARPLPEDWKLSEELGQWAEQRGLTPNDVLLQRDKFYNYWRGCGKAKKDWDATWRNWILTTIERK